jgi:gluconolactonase
MSQTLPMRLRAVPEDSPRLVEVVKTDAHEGPVYVADEDALYFTTTPRADGTGSRQVAIKRLALDGDRFPLEVDRVSVVVAETRVANGMTLDCDGGLLVCEQGTLLAPARIARLDRSSGELETLVDDWEGSPLNSPNDVVVRSDGTVWFTDPSYGHLQGFRPAPRVGDHLYRYDPASDRLSAVAESFDKPNGLAFSPDEEVLYVADSGVGPDLLAFDVLDRDRLGPARRFALVAGGSPDGLKVDTDGRVYVSASTGVQVFNPARGLTGEIHLPGAVNFTFGGPDRNVLFITTDTAVWAAVLSAEGA